MTTEAATATPVDNKAKERPSIVDSELYKSIKDKIDSTTTLLATKSAEIPGKKTVIEMFVNCAGGFTVIKTINGDAASREVVFEGTSMKVACTKYQSAH